MLVLVCTFLIRPDRILLFRYTVSCKVMLNVIVLMYRRIEPGIFRANRKIIV